jgi:hypothetical protein
MSYQSIVVMAGSQSLRARMIAAAAAAGSEDPAGFVDRNMWQLVSADGLDIAWQYATDNYNVNMNPDFGARTDVIGDEQIHDAVTNRMAELATAQPAAQPLPVGAEGPVTSDVVGAPETVAKPDNPGGNPDTPDAT